MQRKGIYDIMSRDIGLLHKAVRLLPPISMKGLVDLDMVLDELWAVTQEEMNFLIEASNMEEFAKKMKMWLLWELRRFSRNIRQPMFL